MSKTKFRQIHEKTVVMWPFYTSQTAHMITICEFSAKIFSLFIAEIRGFFLESWMFYLRLRASPTLSAAFFSAANNCWIPCVLLAILNFFKANKTELLSTLTAKIDWAMQSSKQ